MSIDFKIRNFAHPLTIAKLHNFMEKSQWFPREQMREYQLKRLKAMVRHCYDNIPYYKRLFDSVSLKPTDIKSLEDLKKIPTLTKEMVRRNFEALTARNVKRYTPSLCCTTGTSGEPVSFYSDKASKVLEFCYYWRYWSWAGYSLGMPFADFSLHAFLDSEVNVIVKYSRLTRRLLLNPAHLSMKNLDLFVSAIRKKRCRFLKGCPSTLYAFSILLKKKGVTDLPMKCIFTTGELLLPHQRKDIEKAFHCSIIDSYGHMERTAAISQCPSGQYHIHSDYGILEVKRNEQLSGREGMAGTVIGTNIYNYAMPLLRYNVNDLVELDSSGRICECGRQLPLCKEIIGRRQDIISTPDGKLLTNVFILYGILEGVIWAQIIQEDISTLRVRIVKDNCFNPATERVFFDKLRGLVGGQMKLVREYPSRESLQEPRCGTKYKPVISKVEIPE